ncbi:MAG: excinuclease ABC subunit C [Saprospiraceae bacterium]|jgi:excinuclease ABC subunit C
MTTEDYKKIQHTLPKDPGVYRFLDKEGVALYVGKAKNLKNRLASYFGSTKHQAAKTKTMVKNAHEFIYTIVETETDALLLESTLIKKFQPRYNVMLKDGKTYNYICIKNERFPRVMVTRYVNRRDGATYFGPYTSKVRVKIILDLIKSLFPLRTCTYNLSEDNINKGKFKVCLEYHIKNCLAPCVKYEQEEEYNEKISQIKNILRGSFGSVKRHFQEKMQWHAENLEFEKAGQIKEKLSAFEDYQGKSTVVSTTIRDVDVFTIASDDKNAYVNYLKVVNGAIMNTYTQEMVKNLDEDEKDLLAFTIPTLRKKFQSLAPEILVPFEIEVPEEEAAIVIPKIGDKKKLVDLSAKNVQYFLLQKRRQEINNIKKQTSAERILRTMQEDLQMDDLPMHIECFDNSNIQGTHPVASCVVFKNAKPSKKDFASMEEVVGRRYSRLVREKQPLPNLIIIDGGKGQLSSAVRILTELGILNQITVIGIAKRLEEIFFANDSIPLYINKKSETLKVIQHARNEAHRFAITFHRNKRSQFFTTSELLDIPGIGEKTADKLLTHFASVKKVREATVTEVAEIIGLGNAKKVQNYFLAKLDKQSGEEEE